MAAFTRSQSGAGFVLSAQAIQGSGPAALRGHLRPDWATVARQITKPLVLCTVNTGCTLLFSQESGDLIAAGRMGALQRTVELGVLRFKFEDLAVQARLTPS